MPSGKERCACVCAPVCTARVCASVHARVCSTPGAAITPLSTTGWGAVKIVPSDSFHFARLTGRVKGVVVVACWPPPPGSETALLRMDSNPQSLP